MNIEQELKICQQSNLSLTQIAKNFKISIKQVKRILKSNGFDKSYKIGTNRKYNLNEDFFNIIDIEEKSYILGLLYADGCNNNKEGKIYISLQEKDKNILDKITKIIQPTKPLKYIIKNGNRQNQFKLTINSRKLSNNLVNLGCMQNKTFLLNFPKFLNDSLLIHFIRGYFDGDGCIQSKQSIIVGTEFFCIGLQSFLKTKNINSSIYDVYNKNNKITKNLFISGKLQSKKFLDLIYNNATIFLDRKYEKYLSL